MVYELILKNWVELLFALATAVMSLGYKTLATKLKEEEKKNDCIADGVRCLLRQSILNTYHEYNACGYCPVHIKESVSMAYEAYTGLGGNDVATVYYHKILELPTDPKGERNE